MRRLFGTDGVRGIAGSELSCETAMKIGAAVASVLHSGKRDYPKILVGIDTRASGKMLFSALAAGICSVGGDVLDVDVIPTPAVAYLIVKYKATAGIVISASHNPACYNGIKVFNGDGYKLADELEEQVEEIVFGDQPRLADPCEVGTIIPCKDAVSDYVSHIRSTALYSLEGLNIAVDCANGASSRTAKKLFQTSLGANCTVLSSNPDGTNINDKCGSTAPEALSLYVKKHGLDGGAAFDGDADRCIFVDENGEIIDGDMIMAMLALDMKARGKLAKNTVIGTIMTNFGFSRFCEENGIKFVQTKVGDRYVAEEMQLEDCCFGGEQSGHLIFRDFSTTGDGELTAVQLFSLMRRTGKKLSELSKAMKKYPQFSYNIQATPEQKIAFLTDEGIKAAVNEAKETLGTGGRIVARPSGTEPLIRIMAEGDDEALVKAQLDKTVKAVEEKIKLY